MNNTLRRFGVAALTAAMLFNGILANAQRASVMFDLPAQSLADALNAVGKLTDTNILINRELIGERQAPALKAQMTVNEALGKLLEGTGLTPRFVDDNTVVLAVGSVDVRGAPASSNTQSYQSEAVSLAQVETLPAGQESAQAADRRESPASSESGGSTVQEIIVTAQKRAERLQDVPASLSVVSGDEISRRGLVNAEDYLRGIPGVNQVGGSGAYGGQLIVIRGLETSLRPQNFYSGPTTATYFGETPTTTAGGLVSSNVDIKLVDIERVEVLRGPQGTAMGSSSMGGAVRTIPVEPKLDRFEGRLGAGFSQTSGTGGENYMFQAVGNLPVIAGKLAVRATAYAFSDSGYYRNRAGSDAAFQAALVAPFRVQAYATDEENAGAYYATGGRIAALFQATDSLRFTLNYLKQKNETNGWGLATSGTYDQTLLRVAPENVYRGQTGGVLDTKIDIANAVMEYDFGWADMLATYSFTKSGQIFSGPYGVFNIPFAASADRVLPHREQDAEIRLATKLEGAWNFLAGLYAEKQFDSQTIAGYWTGDPATNPFVPGGRFFTSSFNRRDRNQQAAFGEASWKFRPGWTLTGGARVFQFERSQQNDAFGPLVAGGFSTQQGVGEASGAIYRTNLSYKPADNSLLYVSWAQGFRPGQTQPPPFQRGDLCDRNADGIADGTSFSLDSFGTVESDTVDNYELGGKFALFDRRLTIDAAVFRMEWANIPISQLLPCNAGYTVNGGTALSEGVELQVNFQVTAAMRADFGGSWINARLTEDVPPPQNFHDGDRMPGAPKVNTNLGLQYAFDIAGHAAFVRTDGIYVGSFYTNVIQSAGVKAGGYVKLDATARVAFDKSLNIDFYVRNLTNEDAFTLRGTGNNGPFFGYRLQPRTIGLQLNYSF